jgi:hypothetical protein
MAGLTNAGLSNWYSSFHNTFAINSGSSFVGLADDGFGNWVTVERTVGLGHLIITGQDPDFHSQFGYGAIGANSPKIDLVSNALRLSPEASTVPEPASITLAGMGILGLVGYGIRRRRQTV